MLLTDGDPNVFPKDGFLNTLKKYQKSKKDFNPTINTYALGKSIDSVLLD